MTLTLDNPRRAFVDFAPPTNAIRREVARAVAARDDRRAFVLRIALDRRRAGGG